VKLGILADSHDHVRNIHRAVEIFRERGVEAVVHAGDVVAPFAAKALAEALFKEFGGELVPPVYAVYGNNDGERAGLAKLLDITPAPREVVLEGRTVILAHEPGEIPDWMKEAADVVITGHTHEVVMPGEKDKPMSINPGEAGGWLAGRATCAVLDLKSMKAELCEIGEP
jgi:putative phosphoesterase